VIPAVLLAYGPFAAVLLRTAGPEPYAIAFPTPFLAAVVESLGVAVAAAVAVGVAGYAIGRVAAGIGGDKRESDAAPRTKAQTRTTDRTTTPRRAFR